MATTTLPARKLTLHQRAVRSTVAMKALMAITGLIMVAFLLMHMYGNTKIFMGHQAFDDYSHHLRTLLEPILPYEGFLWLFRIFMLLAIAGHIVSAVALWGRNKRNVPSKRYAKGGAFGNGGYVPFIMRWGGVLILAFLIFHILQFTTETVTIGYEGHVSPADRFVLGFQHWWLVAVYAVAILFVCLHVWRGFWSAFATLGANVSKKAEQVLNVLAAVIAVALFVGFMAAPVAVLMGAIS